MDFAQVRLLVAGQPVEVVGEEVAEAGAARIGVEVGEEVGGAAILGGEGFPEVLAVVSDRGEGDHQVAAGWAGRGTNALGAATGDEANAVGGGEVAGLAGDR